MFIKKELLCGFFSIKHASKDNYKRVKHIRFNFLTTVVLLMCFPFYYLNIFG